MNKNLKGSLILVLAALVWGLAFVAQKDAAGGIDLFAFTFARSVITCAVLAPLCAVRFRRNAASLPSFRAHVRTGIVMGVMLFAAVVSQQLGLNLGTSAGKSGFITALYIVMVPLFSMFIGQKYGKKIWLAVILGLAGAALLSLDPSDRFSLGVAEGVTLICAIVFSFHIIFIDNKTGGYDSCILNAVQFGVCGILGLICMILFEKPDIGQFADNIGSILYVGAFSGALGYTLQLIGQKYASPALASLVMCLESVFALLGGWIIGGEVLMIWEYAGCVLLLGGCVVAQLPDRHSIA